MDANDNTLNILLMGPSGVGKSTFINSFINLTMYESLPEAEKSGIVCLISTKFDITLTDSTGNTSTYPVHVGNDDNEKLETGESATQGCKSYVFNIKKRHQQLKVRFHLFVVRAVNVILRKF